MPTLAEAVFVLLVAGFSILSAVQVWETDVHIPLVLSAVVAAVLAMTRMKVSWAVIEDAMLSSILMGMQAVLILYTVGMLIGAWLLSGVVPSMIYYGLNVIAPSIFLIATLIICSVVSLATGTSWGTTGTVGIALLGIGAGLGVPPAVCAGFAISGAYFGDKMSPLSDTTNLAPAMAGTDVFQHIRAMCWTTAPTCVIVLVVAAVMGREYASGALDIQGIQALQELMRGEFSISLWGFVPPLLVIGLAASQKPAIPSIFAGVLAGCFLAILQGADVNALLEVLQNGYKPDLAAKVVAAGKDFPAISDLLARAGVVGVSPEHAAEAAATLNTLLTRGGLQSMNWTVSLIFCALSFGGILDRCGFLEVLLECLLKKVHTAGGLVGSVIAACLMANVFTGDQYIAIVLPGRMFRARFEKWGLHARMLSRSLEDCGTLTSALVPWNTCGAYQSKALGVPTVDYLPYALLNWLNPIVALLMTYMGVGIAWRSGDGDDFTLSRTKPENV
jgi:NhaC family Na+:H+ antiporter